MTYEEWIQEHCLPGDRVNGKCAERTQEMAAAFPELRRVRGHAYLLGCPEPRPHWWLEAPDGSRIDPTESQWTDPNYIYAGCVVLGYDPLPEDFEEPIGKCMACGGYCYPSTPGANSNACSTACIVELERYYG